MNGFKFDPKMLKGYEPSERSNKDFTYAAARPSASKSILPKRYMLDILDIDWQSAVGKCVGEAFQADAEADEKCKGNDEKLSSRFHYEQCKAIDNIPYEGTTLKVGAQVMLDKGICKEELYPFDGNDQKLISDMCNLKFQTPPPAAFEDAKTKRIEAYAVMPQNYFSPIDINQLLSAIVSENGVVAGLMVTDSFVKDCNGVVGKPGGKLLGGHAVFVCGYDLDEEGFYDYSKIFRGASPRKYKGFLYFKNTWKDEDGNLWGDNGMGKLPIEELNYMTDPTFMPMRFVEEIVVTIRGLKEGDNFDRDYHKRFNESNVESLLIEMWLDNKIAKINGAEITLDVAPTLSGSRTVVPLRFVSETLGYKTNWNQQSKEATILNSKGDTVVRMWLGKNKAIVNGKEVTVDTTPFIVDGRMLVPLRFVSEALGFKVEWNQTQKKITIKS